MKAKKLLATIILFSFLTAGTIYAQTNVFPASGNVGIGTTNPLASLDVYGWQYLRDANYPLLMLSSNNSSALYNVGIHFDGSGGANMNEIRFGKYLKSSGTWQSNPFRLSILAPDGSFFMNSSGNIGIGNSAPIYKLHVSGDIYADQGSLMVSKSSNEGGQLNIFNHNKTALGQKVSYSFFNMTGNYGNKFSIWGYPSSGYGIERFSIWDNGTFTFNNTLVPSSPIVYILGRGSVGIGVSDTTKLNIAGYKLFVGGGILTEKIKVASYATWADYVFAADYKLNSLNQVENFIQQNKHLPNIPSAKEIKEQGIDLVEMQAKQMEKIEELTLYLIEQNKTLIEQKDLLKMQDEKIKQLENAFKNINKN